MECRHKHIHFQGCTKKKKKPFTRRGILSVTSNHHLSSFIIMEHHELVGHFGQEYALVSLLLFEEQMASLPQDRLTPDQPPFSSVGIDFFGRLYLKQRRSIVKHYGYPFSCLTMTATHIEVTESLDTDLFVNALRRFINCRGHPKMIRSDNGTNLNAGEREI